MFLFGTLQALQSAPRKICTCFNVCTASSSSLPGLVWGVQKALELNKFGFVKQVEHVSSGAEPQLALHQPPTYNTFITKLCHAYQWLYLPQSNFFFSPTERLREVVGQVGFEIIQQTSHEDFGHLKMREGCFVNKENDQ